MANINDSSNQSYDPINESYELIASFDLIESEQEKLDRIRQLELSGVQFLKNHAEILQERLESPPPPIPNKSVFQADYQAMDKEELASFINEMRFMLAVKYSTL